MGSNPIRGTNKIKMALSDNQKSRLEQMKKYVHEVKEVERQDFDEWFKGKREFCVNIGAWIILIEKDS